MKSPGGNYYIVPGPTGEMATLYTLGEASAFCTNAVVMIAYSNPGVKKPEPVFFPILRREQIQLPGFEAARQEIVLKAKTSKQEYIKKVNALKDHIQQGNIYEINFCLQFLAEQVTIDPLDVFVSLRNITKAPYCALLKTGQQYIICGSPELFLKKEGSLVSSKPIKGTIRRGHDAAEDDALKQALHNSVKERTENVMAVDVARNDLSHFAKRGTVKVNRLYNIETFETVHQMVSTVSCEMKEGTNFEQMLEATFPMASMTGAPKIRAMQLIDEFEDFERGSYSGAMGIMDQKGDFTLSVIIRSIFYNEQTQRLSIAVGGAITYLCDPETEYEECMLKANGLLRALNATLG